ncbi:MAG: hypothetical protein WCY89_03405 [Flavobacteriaceae bacterium]
MKYLLVSIFLLQFSFLYAQESSDIDIQSREIIVFDECTQVYFPEKIELMFNVFVVSVERNNGWYSFYVFNESEIQNDTLILPRISFATTRALDNQESIYLYCNDIADGIIRDFYQNGNVRIEGKFTEGKPNYISEYNIEGILQEETFYELNSMDERINLYNDKGELREYIVIKNKKRKRVVLTYNAKNKLVDREVIKFIKY